MNKRRIIAVLIAFVLTIAATAMWSAATIEREGDPDVNVLEDSGSDAGTVAPEQKKGGGNKIVKVLAAPFKAFGSLFKRNNDGKFQRMSEKDAEKFQSVGVERVDDGRSPERKLSASGSAKEHMEIGRQLLLSGQINEAISELSMAASLDSKLTEAHNLLGVAYDQKGLVDRAKASYEKAVKSDSDDPETLNNLGFSLYKAGNYRAAVDRLKRAAKLAPTDERILNNLGLALCRLGKFDDAYKSFARAGGPLTGNLNIAKMLERFGREDDAIKYYEDARKIDPNNSIALRRLADLYQRVGKTAEAEEARVALAARSNGNGSVATMER
ncbi:MAG TPA: tetratricopeptide repeat protein [Pyrinomonadaceae bacterium]|jgi:Flp pilus assembly protein TadD|nr:tetratricopeptide repeat protein [Pyrinomonadaceae bacterium]